MSYTRAIVVGASSAGLITVAEMLNITDTKLSILATAGGAAGGVIGAQMLLGAASPVMLAVGAGVGAALGNVVGDAISGVDKGMGIFKRLTDRDSLVGAAVGAGSVFAADALNNIVRLY